jgi:hypothetical protein
VDPTPVMVEQLSLLKEVFIKKFISRMGEQQKPIAEHRFDHAVRLYYRVMETLLQMVRSLPRVGNCVLQMEPDEFSVELHYNLGYNITLSGVTESLFLLETFHFADTWMCCALR